MLKRKIIKELETWKKEYKNKASEIGQGLQTP